MRPTKERARQWLDRWDRQQEVYNADREERFAVIADVVSLVTERPDPLIVDLGAGPGSLSIRLLDRIPGARVVAIDGDPFLLGLGRAAYADLGSLELVCHDLRDAGWVSALELPRPADAVVSTTALHWLTRSELAEVYGASGALLAPGGVLVNGDHLGEGPGRSRLDRLAIQVAGARADRVTALRGRTGVDDAEDWAGWWAAAGAAPELADLLTERGARPVEHTVPDEPTLQDHLDLLDGSGFTEVGPVWSHGNDRVLVALR